MKKGTVKKPAAKPGAKRASMQQPPEESAGGSQLQAPAGGNVKVAQCATNARTEVEKWAKRALDKGVIGLREEFADLRRYCPPDMQVGTFVTHWEAGRNRYKDVPCQDKYRVVLKWPGQAYDYIHANYVATPINDKRFICTQGPLDCTITDFWHMTVQEESDSLIMLCNTKEKGMDKCAQYWPLEEKQSEKYGDVEVTNLCPNVRLSVLKVCWTAGGEKKEREVRHYQWANRLAGPRRAALQAHRDGPPLVRIGRTGTIVAIEFILERMQQGIACEEMDSILKELRNQRPYSIQTDLRRDLKVSA
ncbi:hypothetical protein M3Y99_01860200 [Aphelenchoides fujianensis]|nr:hypothetical protein M3Y99_01860200 [Aphelenchoides fujianensis]